MTYKISFNHIDFLNLAIDMKRLMFTVGKSLGGMEAFKNYCWDNISLKDVWQDVGGSFVKVEGLNQIEKPDITVWNGANLILSQNAFEAIARELEPYGEFLPITIDGNPYKIFNCLNTVETDKSQSEADIVNDLWMGVKSIGFDKGTEINNLIFKTRFDRCSSLYCGDKFKTLIEAAGLKGIYFSRELVSDF